MRQLHKLGLVDVHLADADYYNPRVATRPPTADALHPEPEFAAGWDHVWRTARDLERQEWPWTHMLRDGTAEFAPDILD